MEHVGMLKQLVIGSAVIIATVAIQAEMFGLDDPQARTGADLDKAEVSQVLRHRFHHGCHVDGIAHHDN